MATILKNFGQAAKLIRAIEKRQNDLKPVFNALRQIPLNEAKQAFRNERDPVTGKAWDKLKPATTRQRVTKSGRKRGSTNILRRKGQRGGMSGTIRAIALRDRLVWGTNLVSDRGYPYPDVHQRGTKSATSPKIPKRRFLGLSQKTEGKIFDAISEYVAWGMVSGKRIRTGHRLLRL